MKEFIDMALWLAKVLGAGMLGAFIAFAGLAAAVSVLTLAVGWAMG